jgi:hypothetical protein
VLPLSAESGYLSGAGPADMHERPPRLPTLSVFRISAETAWRLNAFLQRTRVPSFSFVRCSAYAALYRGDAHMIGWDMMTCGIISVVPTAPVQAAVCF